MPDSIYLGDKVNDHLLGLTAFGPPATIYFALMTAMPVRTGGGTEATGGSYARVAVTNNTTNFPNSSNSVKSNGTDIDWGTLSADLGTVLGVAAYDQASGGNLLFYTPFAASQTISAGNTFKIPAGSLTITRGAAS